VIESSGAAARKERRARAPAKSIRMGGMKPKTEGTITPEFMADMKRRHAEDYAERIRNLGPLPF
jgi:hypothetical protein